MKQDNKMVNDAKHRFAERYDGKTPYQYGIIAAAARSYLYSPNANRVQIRDFWKQQLEALSIKYIESSQSEEQFINDVQTLKETMNVHFKNSFQNGNDGYENGFRIAHAQKSLSICLKHLWCRGNMKYLPPVCPIDRTVLSAVGCFDAWTKVNTIESYKNHLTLVKKISIKSGFSSIAEWELMIFDNQQNG